MESKRRERKEQNWRDRQHQAIPTPYTPQAYTVHRTPLRHTPYTLQHPPCTLHPTPYAVHPKMLHPTPYTRNLNGIEEAGEEGTNLEGSRAVG